MAEDNRPIIDENKSCTDEKNGITICGCTVLDNGNISGRTEEGKKALYVIDKNTWFYGSDIGRKNNLVSLSDRTEEERKLLGSKGGIKTKENREAKKDFNELAKSMLNVALSDNQAKKLLQVDELPDFIDENNLNVGAIMIAKGIQECIENGSFKWFESIRDTAGYKPKNEMEINADIMTDADRSLIEKLNQRIG